MFQKADVLQICIFQDPRFVDEGEGVWFWPFFCSFTYSLIRLSSVNALSRIQGLFQEHWALGRETPWMGDQAIAGHHAHTLFGGGRKLETLREQTLKENMHKNTVQTVTQAQDWARDPGGVATLTKWLRLSVV